MAPAPVVADLVTDCQRCGGNRANNAFLCFRCEKQARQLLAELPWWLDRLTEAAIGQTRMSDNGGRKSARRKDLDGETPLAACIEQLPDADDLDKARAARERAALAHALAAGGINARASELLAEVADALAYWVRVLCEARGITAPTVRSGRSLGVGQALWLAVNVAAISASENAAEIVGDIEDKHDEIVRVVNRPVRVMFLGHCQTWDDREQRYCGVTLRAPQDSVEVYCPRCKVTHNCHRLLLELVDEAERNVVPWDELCRTNRRMPEEYRVPARTLSHWRATGVLRPRQWQRTGGRIGVTQHDDADVPLFSWADVKRLRLRKPQKRLTGASARRDG